MTIKCYASIISLVIFSCICTNAHWSHATDTILANQILSGNQTVVSSGGNFELGFFTPGKSSKYYIGIWYKNVAEQTVVWVANRDTPIYGTHFAQLTIRGGNLVLLNESRLEIWSTDLNSMRSNNSAVFAVLLDSGNLVLREKLVSESNISIGETTWESFNHPAHTLMPGAKLAYDKRTHKRQVLTSWKNPEDPAPGLFSAGFGPNNDEYVIRWNKSKQFWTSGNWNGHIFGLLPETRLGAAYNYSFVNNENETYFMYSLFDSSVIARHILDTSGQLKHLTWKGGIGWILPYTAPRQQCDVYAYCGPFGTCNQNSMPSCTCLPGFKPNSEKDWALTDYSGGCVRETNLECQNDGIVPNGRRDQFLTHSNLRFSSYSQLMGIESKGQCESACLRNCSCSAYAYNENGCLLWNGELLNLQQLEQGDGSGKTIHIRHSASSSVFHVNHKNHEVVVISIISGSVATTLFILATVLVVIWNQQRKKSSPSKVVEGSLVGFSYKELQLATNNFSVKLGGGGFGTVFKGTLQDSTVIAVKKLESIDQGEKQFRTEVKTIGAIQHMNLVRLRGFCPEHNKKLLVYDYMEHGSLDSHLFNAKDSMVLGWEKRYKIALEIARGLAYLHENCREYIIHCDVKPENILLDANYQAKVGDFGLAKLMGRDFSRVLTTIRGTRGYLAPEWLSGVPITAKIDVFSYGKILFELVSGRRNLEYLEDGKGEYFPYVVANVINGEGDILGLLDPILDSDADEEEVATICKVACWCIQDDENIRPSMGQVVQILEGVMGVSLPPIPRSLEIIFYANTKENTMVLANSSSASCSEIESTTSNVRSDSKTTTT